MPPEALEAQIEALVVVARDGGMHDATIVQVLDKAVAALEEGLS